MTDPTDAMEWDRKFKPPAVLAMTKRFLAEMKADVGLPRDQPASLAMYATEQIAAYFWVHCTDAEVRYTSTGHLQGEWVDNIRKIAFREISKW